MLRLCKDEALEIPVDLYRYCFGDGISPADDDPVNEDLHRFTVQRFCVNILLNSLRPIIACLQPLLQRLQQSVW